MPLREKKINKKRQEKSKKTKKKKKNAITRNKRKQQNIHKIKYKLGFSTLINQGGSSHFHN